MMRAYAGAGGIDAGRDACRRRAAAGQAEPVRRDLARPVQRRAVRAVPQPLHRRPRADGEGGRGVPRRLPEPCRDRDLPRPFDADDRAASGGDRHHRQQLVRRRRRADRLLRVRRRRAGAGPRGPAARAGLPQGLDVRRMAEGRRSEIAELRGIGQGPRRDHHGGAQSRWRVLVGRRARLHDLGPRGHHRGGAARARSGVQHRVFRQLGQGRRARLGEGPTRAAPRPSRRPLSVP